MTDNKLVINYRAIVYGLICLFPFWNIYDDNFILIIYYSIILVYIFMEIYKNQKIKNLNLLLFSIWSFITFLIGWLNLGATSISSRNRAVDFFVSITLVIIFSKDRQIDYFVKVYSKIAKFSVAFFYFQVFVYYIFDKAVVINLPFLQLNNTYNIAMRYLETAANMGIIFPRFHGPFTEPSIYAYYVMPLLLFYLYGVGEIKRNYLAASIICVSLIMSTSGLGMVMGVICIAYYIWQENMNSRKQILWIPVLLVILIIASFLVYATVPTVKSIVDNLFFSTSSNTASKADYRIYRGFYLYSQLDFVSKIKGIGMYNAEAYTMMHNITNKYDISTAYYEYFNGIAQILLYTGFVGGILFFRFVIKEFPYKTNLEKGIKLLYIMSIVASSYFLNGQALIVMGVVYGTKLINQNCQMENYR